jgi:hypothetical protein
MRYMMQNNADRQGQQRLCRRCNTPSFHRRFSAPTTQQSEFLRAAQNMRVVMRENAGQSGAAERSIYSHHVRNRSLLTASCVQKSTSSSMIAFYRGVLSF